jgi:peptide deformylase
MTALPIVTDIEALRVKSQPVTVFDDDLRRLAADMVETMRANNGIGLAAVQVGVPMRVIVVGYLDGSTEVMVNPKVINPVSREWEKDIEGCLSLPGQAVLVRRRTSMTVMYQTVKGYRARMYPIGRNARIIQHELDHLKGVLITDYAQGVAR